MVPFPASHTPVATLIVFHAGFSNSAVCGQTLEVVCVFKRSLSFAAQHLTQHQHTFTHLAQQHSVRGGLKNITQKAGWLLLPHASAAHAAQEAPLMFWPFRAGNIPAVCPSVTCSAAPHPAPTHVGAPATAARWARARRARHAPSCQPHMSVISANLWCELVVPKQQNITIKPTASSEHLYSTPGSLPA
jgi:hypothetical protein